MSLNELIGLPISSFAVFIKSGADVGERGEDPLHEAAITDPAESIARFLMNFLRERYTFSGVICEERILFVFIVMGFISFIEDSKRQFHLI